MKSRKFKSIGIVGGAGPAAGSLLFNKVISWCQQNSSALEDEDYPEIVLVSYPFSTMITTDKSDHNAMVIAQELKSCISKLITHGIQVIGIACNTLHSFLEDAILFSTTDLLKRL